MRKLFFKSLLSSVLYHNKFIALWTSMFNVATFWEILLTSSANVSGSVVHIYSKYADLDENKRNCEPGWEVQCH